MKSLIVGMGIGELYKKQLLDMGADVTTVDVMADADYTDISDLPDTVFDTVNICTPNYLHAEHMRALAHRSRIVVVEKPGVQNASEWRNIIETHHRTRFMMVKNNQFRSQLCDLMTHAAASEEIDIVWHNCDRVPKPGSWFTNKKLAFGGVSRDLMPHLLSWVQALFPLTWTQARFESNDVGQRWGLSDLTQSDYGAVDVDGIYDVDDRATIRLVLGKCLIRLSANWRTLREDDRNITFSAAGGKTHKFEFGLCPDYAYRNMMQYAIDNVDNHDVWVNEFTKDMWIHSLIGSFEE